jgi:UbiD family decarboxylase
MHGDRGYADLHDHLDRLDKAGLLLRIDAPVESPFGESHGYVALEEYNLTVEVTAITRRRDAIVPSIISRVTPTESSVIKRLAYEPAFLSHLRDSLAIKGIRRVGLHEPLTNLRKLVILQFAAGTPRSEVWRALNGTLTLQAIVGKFVVAVDKDIDPGNADSIFWAMSYRCNPLEDNAVVRLFARRLERDFGRRRARGRPRPRHGSRRLLPATAPQGRRPQHADPDHRGNQG